jgi:glycosyltransferase involved in cell wall biosynthesis
MCNKDTERFSIVISTYNRAWSIERAIDSVLNQSYKNWELIIIDDGSTDDTEKILRKKYLENPKIKLFHHKNKENRGVAASQNLAMRNLSGMYYCFLGSDDELSPKALEIAHTYFTKLQDVKCLLFKGQSFSVNEDITSLPFDYAVVSYDDYLVNPLYDFEAFLFQHRELIDNGYFFDEDILRESVRHKRVAKKYKTAFINKTVAIFHKEGNDRVCYNSTPTENYTRIFEGERRFLEENGKRLKQLSSFQYN